MTREDCKKYKDIIEAFANGANVQYRRKPIFNENEPWTDTDSPAFNENYEYRIKPASKLRPWTVSEVPIGALIRLHKQPTEIAVILGTIDVEATLGNLFPYVILSNIIMSTKKHFIADLLTYHGGDNQDCYEYSTNNGKTWNRCGVAE